jgi:hypothetical protein
MIVKVIKNRIVVGGFLF